MTSQTTKGADRLPPDERPDPQALDQSLADLRAHAGENGLDASLAQLLEAAVDLFSASGAGFMMMDSESIISAVSWTEDPGRSLERCEQELGDGPCVQAMTLDRVVLTEDLAADARWPALIDALPDQRIRALVGVPVRIYGAPVGAVDVYRDEPGGWSESEIRGLEAYGKLIETFLIAGLQAREREQLTEQLQRALDNRVVIERAVGVIMARNGLDAVAAFNILRSRARSRRCRVVDVALELLSEVSGGQSPAN
jgi:GAF domain-containing protein